MQREYAMSRDRRHRVIHFRKSVALTFMTPVTSEYRHLVIAGREKMDR